MNKKELAKKMIADEKKGIKEYSSDIKKTKGKEHETFEKILPDEKKHLKMLNKIK